MESVLKEDHSRYSTLFTLGRKHPSGQNFSEVENEITDGERGIKPVIASLAERTDYIAESKYHPNDLHDLIFFFNLMQEQDRGEPVSGASYFELWRGRYSPEVHLAFNQMEENNTSRKVLSRKNAEQRKNKIDR